MLVASVEYVDLWVINNSFFVFFFEALRSIASFFARCCLLWGSCGRALGSNYLGNLGRRIRPHSDELAAAWVQPVVNFNAVGCCRKTHSELPVPPPPTHPTCQQPLAAKVGLCGRQ